VITPRFFSASAALQDFLLQEAGPGTLVVVPHHRLAQQLWQRQRRGQLLAGRPAWEPLPLKTFQGWLQDLFNSLWSELALAAELRRLSCWLRALEAAPEWPGAAPSLPWARALDEAYSILGRHALLLVGRASPPAITVDDSPLIAWRNQVFQIFSRLLTEGGWLTPGELPAYLLARLNEGKLALPERLLVAGLGSPALAEAAFLEAVAQRTRVLHLQVKGDPRAVSEAVVLPDRSQEVAWVAARLVEAAGKEGLPLHRLAVTAMEMEHYWPPLQQALAELLGPAQGEAGWRYNFSQGPRLAEMPLFLAAVLPLRFVSNGERREDLMSLLLSPFYAGLDQYRSQTARWDRLFRERQISRGWPLVEKAIAQEWRAPGQDLLPRLARLWQTLKAPGSAGEWRRRLQRLWRELQFGPQDAAEGVAWDRLSSLLRELDATLGAEPMGADDFLTWLEQGAEKVLLPGLGVQEAGIQVLGLLEMRGLDFSRVFCLGLNSGALPPPPRVLPLLAPAERRVVLGGTYASQHEFARELYDTLLGTAPELVLTRPKVIDDEERVGSPLYLGPWEPQEMAPLSRPHPAWLRSPAVRAALSGAGISFPGYGDGPLPLDLPAQVSMSWAATALGCPCHFLLEFLLKLEELPEIEADLDPRERGERLHQVMARFTGEFQKFLEAHGWDHGRAQEVLQTAARQVLGNLLEDVHWRAEWARWLGGEDGGPSLLKEWLLREKEKYEQGWRWRLIEAEFAGLRQEGWPFALRGRLDRLDYHPDRREAVIWDYKSGKIPKAAEVFDKLQEVQLACYLLAVESGLTGAPRDYEQLRAGFIGLKSLRKDDLKHEDFGKRVGEWPRVVEALGERLKELGRRLAAGDFRPQPTPAPEGNNLGACQYCPYGLLCGFSQAARPEAEEEESE